MKLEDGMVLYHGSYAAINTIDLTQCAAEQLKMLYLPIALTQQIKNGFGLFL